MYHNKRKGTDLRRITVECLFCNLKLNRENFETHRKRHHKNDPKCQYANVNDGKQSKLNFGKSSKGEEEDGPIYFYLMPNSTQYEPKQESL